MKQKLSKFTILIAAAPVVTAAVLVWLLSLDGTLGMAQWINTFEGALIALGLLGAAAPLLALFGRKRRILRGLAMALATLGILVPLAVGALYLRGALQFAATTPPLLLIADGVGANGAPNLALVFRSAQATQNTLTYGEELASQKFTEPSATREHVLPLVNLKPGARYQWQLNDGPTCSFTTPGTQPASDTLVHFAAGGDPHLTAKTGTLSAGDETILPSVLKYVTAPGSVSPFNAFFLLGDFADNGSDAADWEYGLNLAAPFTCSIPLRPLIGNHETYINGTPQYKAYFYPQGMENPNGSRQYYRIDSGRVHFIMLENTWGAERFAGEQRDWFVKQMESIPAGDWKIVMEHSVVFSSASMKQGKQYYDPVAMVQQVAPLFEKYKVDLVITGHEHQLEFLQRNGVSYATVGGLGAPLELVATHKSIASVWYLPKQHGFLDVTVHPNTIDLIFRDPSGNELKSFSIGQNK